MNYQSNSKHCYDKQKLQILRAYSKQSTKKTAIKYKFININSFRKFRLTSARFVLKDQ